MKVLVLFTKDRPWQCSEYLRTFQKYCQNHGDVHLKVIWKGTSPEYISRYQAIGLRLTMQNKFNSISFLNEDDCSSFKNAFQRSFAFICSGDTVMFGVDDVLFYRNFELYDIQPHNVFSYRLGTNINFCQPAGKRQNCPALNTQSSPYKVYGYYLSTNTRYDNNSYDWAYPYELSASAYNWGDIRKILDFDVKTPNFLEESMYLAYLHKQLPETEITLYDKPVCSVITVNRVQNDFKNELAGPEVTSAECLKLFDDDREYDDEKYAEQSYNSIHIGDFFLKELN